MVYNWNKMVTITVPVGLNGWQTRGRVIINGREYTFPVGVETQVPEPVAAHINKLIKMEEEDKPELPESGCVDTVAREQITALTEEMADKKGLTSAQITALDNMFKVCAYTSSANSAYAAFCAAFGITGGGTGGDSDGVNVYFADYSEWYRQGSGISVIDNGFSVVSPELSYSAGIAVGMLQDGKYGDYKDKTLKISYDVAGEISSDASIPIYLRTYTDVPGSDYLENQTAFTRGPVTNQAKHVEWTINPSTAKWESGTPTDTDYMGLQFYFYFVGTATITNFTIEVV